MCSTLEVWFISGWIPLWATAEPWNTSMVFVKRSFSPDGKSDDLSWVLGTIGGWEVIILESCPVPLLCATDRVVPTTMMASSSNTMASVVGKWISTLSCSCRPCLVWYVVQAISADCWWLFILEELLFILFISGPLFFNGGTTGISLNGFFCGGAEYLLLHP